MRSPQYYSDVGQRMLTRRSGPGCYTLPDNEAALKAAKKPEGPEFHYAEGELQKGAAPQPPLVELRAARRGQDADVHDHTAPVEPRDGLVNGDYGR